MGVRTDCQCGSDLLWQVLDNIFLVAFIIEFCLRAIISGIKQFGVMLVSDSWLQFDLMVVTLSIVDTWILGGVGSGGVYTLARLYRLLKLVKMVRVAACISSTGHVGGRNLKFFANTLLGGFTAGNDYLYSWGFVGDHVTMELACHNRNCARVYCTSISHVDLGPDSHL